MIGFQLYNVAVVPMKQGYFATRVWNFTDDSHIRKGNEPLPVEICYQRN